MDPRITSDEMMVFSMARQIKNGETVAQGLATPLVTAAYILARMTHAPDLYFTSAIGQGICQQPAPLSITQIESLWLDRSLTNIGFVRAAADILPTLRPKEFFRPAQVDRQGNFNNIAFSKDYFQTNPPKPRLRLPGTGGIPDVTTFLEEIYLYVPRHSRVTFVEKLDLTSGLGHAPQRTRGNGAKYLVSDLGQFDFLNGKIRLTTFHPGVDIQFIRRHTGCELPVAEDIHPTPLPDMQELRLLRETIDPLGIRRLELLNGAERRELLRTIIQIEKLK